MFLIYLKVFIYRSKISVFIVYSGVLTETFMCIIHVYGLLSPYCFRLR